MADYSLGDVLSKTESSNNKHSGSKRILVFENEPVVSDPLSLRLKILGYEPLVASDLPSARKLLSENDLHGIVCDYEGGAGYTLLNDYRNKYSDGDSPKFAFYTGESAASRRRIEARSGVPVFEKTATNNLLSYLNG